MGRHLQAPGDEPVLVEATIERLMTEYGIEQSALCNAVTWIIEPTDVGRTGLPILGRLLSDGRERQSFFRSVHWYLNRSSLRVFAVKSF